MHKIFTFFIGIIFLLSAAASVFAQNTSLSGTVADKATKEPLPGASITIKGKISGTSTNEAGRFNFTVAETPPFTLVITYIGYKTVEQQVSSSASNLSIELEQQGI